MVSRHGLLDVSRFAGAACSQRVLEMRSRRRRNVHGVDIGVADESVGVVVIAGDSVAAGKVFGKGTIASHDRDQPTALGFLEARTALSLAHVSTADDAPTNRHDGRKPCHTRSATTTSPPSKEPWNIGHLRRAVDSVKAHGRRARNPCVIETRSPASGGVRASRGEMALSGSGRRRARRPRLPCPWLRTRSSE